MAHSGSDQSLRGAWPGGILVVMLVGLGVLVQTPFKPARPVEDKLGSGTSAAVADARLWQDPFAAARAAKREADTRGNEGRRQALEEAAAQYLGCLATSPATPSNPTPDLTACLSGKPKATEPTVSKEPLSKLRSDIATRARSHPVTVLGVMVSGGPSVGAAENRRRSRYAALSAVMAEGYFPEDEEHISYAAFKEAGLPGLMPYEWLVKENGEGSVLVLWLDEDAIAASTSPQGDETPPQANPLARLSGLLGALHPGDPKVRFAIIGPAASRTLVAMSEELARSCSPNGPGFTLPCAPIWSPVATIPAEKVSFHTQASAGVRRPPSAGLCTQAIRACLWHWPYPHTPLCPPPENTGVLGVNGLVGAAPPCEQTPLLDGCPGGLRGCIPGLIPGLIYRTIATDDQLAKLLAQELVQRQVKGQARIALVGQRDTAYSRDLAELVRTEWCKAAGLSEEQCAKGVLRYSYLRGIDGQIPGAKSKEKAAGDTHSDTGAKADVKAPAGEIERADGDAQTDYLRRMRDALVEDDIKRRRDCGPLDRLRQQCGIRAIGVLGNDYFDKLLVLQALTPAFPNAVFFTTDLNADMLHPQHNPFTRNLVVASGYGLDVDDNREFDGWEADPAPPLRDSYQTATLRTVRLALRDIEGRQLPSLMAPEPRLFEIGRTRPVELRTPNTVRLLDHYSLFAPGVWTLTSGVAAFLIALWLGARTRNRWRAAEEAKQAWVCRRKLSAGPSHGLKGRGGRKQDWTCLWTFLVYQLIRCKPQDPHPQAVPQDWPPWWQRPSTFTLASVVLVGLSLLGLLWWDLHLGGEPLSFVQGVSVWPSEILRTLAGVLAVSFFIHGHAAQVKACNDLEIETFPKLNDSSNEAWKGKPGPCLNFIDRPSGTSRRKAEDIWKAYRNKMGMDQTWCRSRLEVLLFLLLATVLMLAFGFPNRPVRSDLSWDLDVWLTMFAVIPFLLLLFYLVDATRQALTVARELSKPVSWRAETLEALGLGAWVDEKGRGADVVWLDVKLIGAITEPVGKLVWYPMLILTLIALARVSVFDAWALSPALVLVLVAGFIYAIGSAYMLRRAAEEVREDARRQLDRALARALDCPDGVACAERIKTLIDKVANSRLGAFRPLSQQPAVRAVLTFISSISGLALMEYLSMANL